MASNHKPTKLTGRIHLIPVRDVDTDMIFHNRYLHITNPDEMGKHIFDNLNGFESFPKQVQPGDIVAVAHNFGCGSSRQQAVDGFIALGVAAIVGESFGAIYRRNAVNAGMPLIEIKGIFDSSIRSLDVVSLDIETGEISDDKGVIICRGNGMTQVQQDIYNAGGLLKLGISSR